MRISPYQAVWPLLSMPSHAPTLSLSTYISHSQTHTMPPTPPHPTHTHTLRAASSSSFCEARADWRAASARNAWPSSHTCAHA